MLVNIIDDSGKIVVKYSYDSFGNHEVYNSVGEKTTDQNDICNINSFRYKGYYFDSETNLYYLQTRYYDPSIGRFILPDSIDYLNNELVDGLNLYAYCGNNPVMYSDESGHMPNWAKWLIGGAVTGGISGALTSGINVATGSVKIIGSAQKTGFAADYYLYIKFMKKYSIILYFFLIL